MKVRKDCFRNVNLLDLYPSLIELCGLPSKELDGKSFKPLLENPELPWSATVTTRDKGNHSVMSEKWHYIIYNNGVEELYDLEKDPMEWRNLANAQSVEFDQVKANLRLVLPKINVDGLPKSRVEKSATEKSRDKIDNTIKQRRTLNALK